MRKVTMFAVVLMLCAGALFAADVTQSSSSPARNLPRIEFYSQINEAVYQLCTNDIPNIITVANAVQDGNVIQSSSTSIINGGTLTPTAGIMMMFSTGSANLNTNTVVLAAPTVASSFLIVNKSTSSNLIAIAASGLWRSSALELEAGEQAMVYSVLALDGTTNAYAGQQL